MSKNAAPTLADPIMHRADDNQAPFGVRMEARRRAAETA